MKRTIKLGGVLGKRFGREYVLDVNGVLDAMSALCNLKPGFERFMRTAEERGLVFAVFVDERNIAQEELGMKDSGAGAIRIMPIIQGSKQAGMFQTLLGVALIVAGMFTGGTTSALGMGLLATGAAVGLGGVVQMLSPTTKANTSDRNEDGNNPSYGFGGAVTTIAQGNPYPLLYGEREIGGAIESGGIYTQDNI
ncbi:Phage-related protein, tail component [Pseudomonas koreensis]|uniref:tail assembly protein n=1 Tax=Pseudomonas koreensis TaxID=198620 RepID=UPI00087C26B8|nr:tail assembly protein [Pseudomonas koreensis]KAB0510915.1 tail assembly protein [Pseudomonas koreensis]NNA64340.1 tail assembly protein [Pseudomonas koreensis]GGK46289.1 bacteriophage protein [Pseudomonas koreensis]SDE18666.1 Phage-related protein, tail component [Pseudomonas koreensis]